MSPILISSSSSSSPSAPVVTDGPSEHPVHSRQAFGFVIWPILFGAFFIALLWGLWKCKAGFWTSESPISTPKPPVSAVAEMARIRGAPIFCRPLAPVASRSSIPHPPPPVYIYPPRYDDIQSPYDEGTRPS